MVDKVYQVCQYGEGIFLTTDKQKAIRYAQDPKNWDSGSCCGERHWAETYVQELALEVEGYDGVMVASFEVDMGPCNCE